MEFFEIGEELTARILGYACAWKAGEAEHIQPVVGTNHNNVLGVRKELSVIRWIVRAACIKSSAIDPEQNGLARFAGLWLRPNVQEQTVFALLIADLAQLFEQLDGITASKEAQEAWAGF